MEACPVSHPDLRKLFPPQQPNRAELEAVLAGRRAGTAAVDDASHPTECVLRSQAYLTFPSSGIRQNALDAGLACLSALGPIWLIWDSALHPGVEPPEANSVRQRIGFAECDVTGPRLAGLRDSLPAGLSVRRIDRELIERCEWREEMVFYCGSLDNFLDHGLGVCLMRGDEILSEAYASALGRDLAEIGAVTREAHRRRGYALLASSFLIELCRTKGYGVYWSCDAENEASAGLARRLGFAAETRYSEYEYTNASCEGGQAR